MVEEDCLSPEKLKTIFPNASLENRKKVAEYIRVYGHYFNIDTKEEVAHFLAQIGAETNGLVTLNATENLNYTTTSRLIQVYPSKFSDTDPSLTDPILYVNNPSGLANLVYCCKYGNGNVSSGDGWRYRGRGVLQLTWKTNYDGYQNYLESIGLSWFYNNPDDISVENGIHAVLSGMWYFKNKVLDKLTITTNTNSDKVTKKINKNTDQNSYKKRRDYYTLAINTLNC